MTEKSRDERIEALFHRAIDIPASERAEFLAEQCEDDPAIVAEVEQLLKNAEAAPSGFLSGPARTAIQVDRSVTDRIDPDFQTIGNYRLLRVLGRGGMGTVYEAEQENPRRRVALKVVRADLVHDQLIRRFLREAQVLGVLQHPGIAHVLEAGSFEYQGLTRPYLAMEFIDGMTLDAYANASPLDARTKVDLMARVCDAAHYAHEQGVVHRDLKPANILVVQEDDSSVTGVLRPGSSSGSVHLQPLHAGRPKILDFGVARITESDVPLVTLETEVGQLVGTLAYMSPEQISARPDQLDRRSDVYSIGVILYELLAGVLPHAVTDRSIPEAARIINDEEPTRLGTLDSVFRGDLETIVDKTLRKDPADRYPSAAELAADLRRFLLDQPVLARRLSTAERVLRWSRRNRSLATALTLLLLLVVGVAIGSTIAAISFREQRDLAQRARVESDQNLYAARMYIAGNSVARDGGWARVRNVLDLTASESFDEFRGWEWYYLASEVHRSILELERFDSQGRVVDAGWSSTGDRIAFLRESGIVSLHDAQSGEQIVSFTPTSPARSLHWSPSGPHLAISTETGVEVRAAASTALIHSLTSFDEAAVATSWSPDGRKLLTVDSRSSLTLWDIESGSAVETIPLPAPAIVGASWQPGGSRIAYWSRERAGVLDLETRQNRELPLDVTDLNAAYTHVEWSPDGRRLAVLRNTGDGVIFGVEPADFPRQASFEIPLENKEASVAWSSDGRFLASSGSTGAITVRDPEASRVVAVIHRDTDRPGPMCWHPERLLLLGNDASGARVWDLQVARRTVRPTYAHPGSIDAVTWSPDSTALISTHTDSGLRRWSREQRSMSALFPASSKWLADVAWQPGGRVFASCEQPGPATIRDAETGTLLFSLGPGNVQRLSWDPTGRILATADTDGRIRLWDGGLRRIVAQIEPPEGERLRQLDWQTNHSGDGHPLICAASKLRIHLIDPNHENIVSSIDHPGTISLSLHPDGSRVVCADNTRRIVVYDTRSGALLHELLGHSQRVQVVDWSPDGTRIASAGNDSALRIWEAESGAELVALGAHPEPIQALAWSPDGRAIATGGRDSSLKIWDATPSYQRTAPASSTDEAASDVALTRLSERRLDARLLELRGSEEAGPRWQKIEAEYADLFRKHPEPDEAVRYLAFLESRLQDASADTWRPIQPSKLAAGSARMGYLVRDHSIYVIGRDAPEGDTYTLTVDQASLLGGPNRLGALALQAISDNNQPGPGAGRTGPFGVAEITVELHSGPPDSKPRRLALVDGVATPSALAHGSISPHVRQTAARLAVDGDATTGWTVSNPDEATRYRTAYFRFETPIDLGPDDRLVIRLVHPPGLNLGRYRFLVSGDDSAVGRERWYREFTELDLPPRARLGVLLAHRQQSELALLALRSSLQATPDAALRQRIVAALGFDQALQEQLSTDD